jgi:hypothetical protein
MEGRGIEWGIEVTATCRAACLRYRGLFRMGVGGMRTWWGRAAPINLKVGKFYEYKSYESSTFALILVICATTNPRLTVVLLLLMPTTNLT